MSKDWTPGELQAASDAMKAAGLPGYEEFCAELEAQGLPAPPATPTQNDGEN